jgi:signal peptidase I
MAGRPQRRRAAIAAGAALLLSLVGCGGQSKDAKQVQATFARFDTAMTKRDASTACATITADYWNAILGELDAAFQNQGSGRFPVRDCRGGLAYMFKRVGSTSVASAGYSLSGISAHGSTATATEVKGSLHEPMRFVRAGSGPWQIDCCFGTQLDTQGTVNYRVPSGSMLPTLKIGQLVTVDNGALRSHAPALGEIVSFHPPAGADAANPSCGSRTEGLGTQKPCGVPTSAESRQLYLKRIVGLPGDRIALVDGHVVRNGARESESYLKGCSGGQDLCSFPQPIVIPAGEYYLLGDNRGASADSRFWGPVKRAWIVGLVKP